MRFSFTGEQEEFRSILRRVMAGKSPTKEVRRLMDTETGWERDAWKKTNQEIGLTAVAIPEAYGGQGFGCTELCIVLEEAGRTVLCAPLFASAMAAYAILDAGDEAQNKALLPGIAAGETVA